MKKSILSIALFLACTLLSGQGAASRDLPKTRVNAGYSWPMAGSGDMDFRLVSVDGVRRGFYVSVGDSYVPVQTADPNSLGKNYVLPLSKVINFCERKVVDGAEVFEPVLRVDTGGLSDFIVAVFQRDGRLHSRTVDLSLENMPLGTMNFVNMQPHPIGLLVGKKPKAMRMLDHFKKPLKNSGGRFLFEYVSVYDLRNPSSPKMFYGTQFRFSENQRAVIFLMGLKKTENSLENHDMQQFVEMCDRGPRT